MSESKTSYSIESEIDKAFPYLNELDEEISRLKKIIDKRKLAKKSPQSAKKRKFNLFRISRHQKIENKEDIEIIDTPKKLRRKTLKHHKYTKDGYEFHIRIINIYEDITNLTDHYEFSVRIKFGEQIKNNQFYKEILNKDVALQYYKNMEGVFKHLTRRDLMERLFKEKRKEINYYKNQF